MIRCGALAPGQQHRPDHQVRPADRVQDVVPVGVEGRDVGRQHVVEIAQPLQRDVQNGDPGAQARRPSWRLLIPTTPPPMITTSAGGTPGTPPSRTPLPPKTFSRYLAPSWTAIRPATSDIGVSSGSSPAGQLDRLVGHRDGLGVDHRPGQLFGGGEVEVGVDHLPCPHPGPLHRDRLLDLHDHLGLGPDLLRRGQDLGPGRDIGLVGKAAPDPGALLDVDRVAPAGEGLRPGRHQRHAVLVGLDFLRDADDHE